MSRTHGAIDESVDGLDDDVDHDGGAGSDGSDSGGGVAGGGGGGGDGGGGGGGGDIGWGIGTLYAQALATAHPFELEQAAGVAHEQIARDIARDMGQRGARAHHATTRSAVQLVRRRQRRGEALPAPVAVGLASAYVPNALARLLTFAEGRRLFTGQFTRSGARFYCASQARADACECMLKCLCGSDCVCAGPRHTRRGARRRSACACWTRRRGCATRRSACRR